jgi:hypothetical protein
VAWSGFEREGIGGGQGKHYPVKLVSVISTVLYTRPILVSSMRWFGKASPPARKGPEHINKLHFTA